MAIYPVILKYRPLGISISFSFGFAAIFLVPASIWGYELRCGCSACYPKAFLSFQLYPIAWMLDSMDTAPRDS